MIAGALTWLAGFVDAVGFLAAGHIYTANMSGNSVAIGIQTIAQNPHEVAIRSLPVAVYVLGVLICRLAVEAAGRRDFQRIASVTFACELALLVPPLFLTSPHEGFKGSTQFLMVGLLALAMGMQNGTLTRFSSLNLHTGFVTGTLVKFAEQFAKFLGSWEQRYLRLSAALLGIWCAYAIGACCGAWAQSVWNLRALWVAIVSLAGMICLDLASPLAVLDEQSQSKLP